MFGFNVIWMGLKFCILPVILLLGINYLKLSDIRKSEVLLTCSSFHKAYGNDGSRGQSAHSRSPPRPSFRRDSFSSFGGHNHNAGMHKIDSWNVERCGTDFHSEKRFDFPSYPQTFEELEMEFKREAMELEKIRDQEEDEENFKHREV